MGDRYFNHSNKTLWYIDASNLYGYTMMQKLPYSTSSTFLHLSIRDAGFSML